MRVSAAVSLRGMALETGYDIARPTGVCAATGRRIAAGEPFVAVLIERDDADRLERRDYTIEGWSSGDAVRGVAPHARVLGHWRGTMPEPAQGRKARIDDAALADLFEQVIEAREGESPGRAAFRYVLALLLLRRRVLKRAGPCESALIVRWARDGEDGEAFEIRDPGMDDASMAEAAASLTAVLSGEDAAADVRP